MRRVPNCLNVAFSPHGHSDQLARGLVFILAVRERRVQGIDLASALTLARSRTGRASMSGWAKTLNSASPLSLRMMSRNVTRDPAEIGAFRLHRTVGAAAMARALCRAKTTISRDLQRKALPSGGYSPLHAARAYQLRRRREAIEQVEDQADRRLPLLVGIEDDLARGTAHITDRHRLAELAPTRLGFSGPPASLP